MHVDVSRPKAHVLPDHMRTLGPCIADGSMLTPPPGLQDMEVTPPANLATPADGRTVRWISMLRGGSFAAVVEGSLDFSGYADYVVTLNATSAVPGASVELVLPMAADNTHYGLGISRPGGLLETWFKEATSCCCGTPRCDTTCVLNSSRHCPQTRPKPAGVFECCPDAGAGVAEVKMTRDPP